MAAARTEVGKRAPPPVATYSVNNEEDSVDVRYEPTTSGGSLRGNVRLKEI